MFTKFVEKKSQKIMKSHKKKRFYKKFSIGRLFIKKIVKKFWRYRENFRTVSFFAQHVSREPQKTNLQSAQIILASTVNRWVPQPKFVAASSANHCLSLQQILFVLCNNYTMQICERFLCGRIKCFFCTYVLFGKPNMYTFKFFKNVMFDSEPFCKLEKHKDQFVSITKII